MTADNRREQLISLGPEALSDALLILASRHDDAAEVIDWMLAPAQENLKRCKERMARFKRTRTWIGRGECRQLVQELLALLDDLRIAHGDPSTGVELVASFYETDHAVFNHCDDAGGAVGEVFRTTARDLFVEYASLCDQKPWLRERVLGLLAEDGFQVRGALVERAAEFLEKPHLRGMVERLWSLFDCAPDGAPKGHWLGQIESLAGQLKDPALFEKARLTAQPDLPPASCFDLAEVYLQAGDPRSALDWLDRIPDSDPVKAEERKRMRLRAIDCDRSCP